MIVFKHGESGGLRDLPFSRKPIPIGRMVILDGITHDIYQYTGCFIPRRREWSGDDEQLCRNCWIRSKSTSCVQKRSYTNDSWRQDATCCDKAKSLRWRQYELQCSGTDVIKDLNILPPGKDAFFNDRIMDDRYASVRAKFARKLLSRKDLGKIKDLDGDGDTDLDDAKAMFDSDEADSDGDGTSNLLERAFGGDSLGPDTKRNMPRRMPSKGGKQRISFVQYKTAFNEEGIEYIVERSTDLRTWTQLGVSQVPAETNDIGGGMERVVWQSTAAVANGSRQYLRLRVRTK